MEVLDHTFPFDKQYAECYNDGAVRNRVPGKGKAENIDKNSEGNHAKVVKHLLYRASQYPAPDLLLILSRSLDSRPEVNKACQHRQDAAYEYDCHSVTDVLG